MTRYIKPILASLSVLIISCSSPKKPAEYYFPEVGLTLNMPSEFKVLDAEQNEALNKKGEKLIEDANNMPVDVSQTKTLISARKSQMDYFNVTITPYNERKDGPYSETSKEANNIIYSTLHAKLPNATIDTVISVKKIGGLEFTEYQITIQVNKKLTMYMFALARYYKGYDFGITYLYTDDVTKSQIQGILQSCKFTK